jgi:hypothetical protein
MTNGDGGDALIAEVLTSIATEYGWPGRMQREREVVTLSIAHLDGLVGTYTLPPGPSGTTVLYQVTRQGERLFAQLQGLGSRSISELYPATADSFFTINGMPAQFTRDSEGRGTKVRLGDIEGIRKP